MSLKDWDIGTPTDLVSLHEKLNIVIELLGGKIKKPEKSVTITESQLERAWNSSMAGRGIVGTIGTAEESTRYTLFKKELGF